MLFTTFSVLGFAAVALAAPALEKNEAVRIPSRGVNFIPRRHLETRKNGRNNRNSQWNNFGTTINIQEVVQQTTINVLQIDANPLLEAQVQAETLFAQTLTEALVGSQLQFNLALDNIRSNTLNQLNNNVNTVAIIVTEISDSRDNNNKNTRYMSRQLQSNPSVTETAFVVIQEQSSLSVLNSIPSSVISAAQASGTGASFAPQFGSFTPGGNATILNQNATISANQFTLYPANSSFPSFANAQSLLDPASIVLNNQQLFVQSTTNTDVFTSVIAAQLAVLLGAVST